MILRTSRVSKWAWRGWWTIASVLIFIALLRDVLVGPAARWFFDEAYGTYLLQPAGPDELAGAIAFVALSYVALFAGFWVASVRVRRLCEHNAVILQPSAALLAAMVIVSVGLCGNLIVVKTLLASSTWGEIVSQRSVYYDESAIYSPLFNYARTLSPLAEIGAWSLMVIGASHRRRFIVLIGLVLGLLYVGLQVLFGGRIPTLVALAGLTLSWHYGVTPLSRRAIATAGLLSLATLGMIQAGRGYAGSISSGSVSVLREAVVGRAVDEMAFARRAFPSTITYLGWNPILDGVRQSFPNNRVVGGRSTWMSIVEDYYGGVNPSAGVGGEHYSFGPEHYMCFGLGGLIGISACCGLVLGWLTRWADLNRQNPLALLLAVSVVCVLMATLFDGRMLTRMGGLPFLRVLPLGFIAALADARRDRQLLAIVLTLAAGLAVCLDGALDTAATEVTSLMMMTVAYAAAFRAVVSGGRRKAHSTNPNANRLHHSSAGSFAVR